MATIGSLSVKLGLVTVEWDQATAKAKKQAKDLQSAFNGLGLDLKNLKNTFNALGGTLGLTAAGFGAMVKSTISFASTIDDVAASFDVSIGKLLQFQQAVVMAGGKTEDASKIMGKMFEKIAAAQSGNEAAISTFQELGISFEELQNLSPDQAINRVYEGLSNIGNTYERVKLVKEILGKGGIGKSVEEIASALQMSTAEFDKNAKAIQTMARVGDELEASFQNLKIAFADLLAPFAKGDLIVGVDTIKSAIIGIGSALAVGGIWKMVEALAVFVKTLREVVSLGAALSVAGGFKGLVMAGAGIAAYFASQKAFEMGDAATANAPTSGGSAAALGGEETKGGRRPELEAMQAKIDMQSKLVDLERQRAGIKASAVNGDKYAADMAEAELGRKTAILQAEQARAQALAKENLSVEQKALIEKQYQADVSMANAKAATETSVIAANRKKELDTIKIQSEFMVQMMMIDEKREELMVKRRDLTEWEYRKAEEKLNLQKKLVELEQQLAEIKQKYGGKGKMFQMESQMISEQMAAEQERYDQRVANIEKEQAISENWADGWSDAFRQFRKDAAQYGKAGADTFNVVVSSMNSAIDQFTRTGKINFRSFALSVIADIAAIQMKAAASSLFSALATKFITSFIMGGVSGGATTESTQLETGGVQSDAGGNFGTATGNADGGYVNGPTWVGENGPEIFIPSQSGAIVPNQRLGSDLGGGVTNVTNNYINAIDTKSFEDRLYQSSKAVWTANRYADKSISSSRSRT